MGTRSSRSTALCAPFKSFKLFLGLARCEFVDVILSDRDPPFADKRLFLRLA